MPSLRMGSRRGTNPGGEMPLVEHIRELRSRLVKAIVALLGGMALGWVFLEPTVLPSWFPGPGRIPGVMQLLQQPYCQVRPDECQLFLFGVLEPFTFRLKIAFILGAVLSSPVWLFQLWRFVTPGLHANERRYTIGFVGSGAPFFAGGVLLAYFAISRGLALFVSFMPPNFELNLKAGQYLTFLVVVMLVFGLSFELPLLVTVLNLAGVLSYERLRQWRRWIVFGIAVFAAVATPTQDPFTMLALAVPMAVLMEIATLIAWFHDRHKARQSPYGELSDDETSALDLDDAYEQPGNESRT